MATKEELIDKDQLPYAIEQYKVFVQSLDHHYSRTQISDRFYLTLNTAIFSIIIFILKEKDQPDSFFLLFVLIPAIIFCVLWYSTIRSATIQALVKHQTLQDMEKSLPMRPYCDEWFDKLREGSIYKPISKTRRVIPWMLISLYTCIGFYIFLVNP